MSETIKNPTKGAYLRREQERRRLAGEPALTKEQIDWHEFWEQSRPHMGGAGAFEAMLFRKADFYDIYRACAGELYGAPDEILQFGQCLVGWLKQRAAGRRPLCLCCDHEFVPDGKQDDIGAALWFKPLNVAANQGMISAVCERCAERSDEELLNAAHKGAVEIGLGKPGTAPMWPGRA